MADLHFNLGLSATPEIDQKKDPGLYAELLRIRNAVNILAEIVDQLAGGTVGQQLTKNSASDFDVSWT